MFGRGPSHQEARMHVTASFTRHLVHAALALATLALAVSCDSPPPAPPPGDPAFCGGIAAFPCATGQSCVDDPRDDCDPRAGGADCGGICVIDACAASYADTKRRYVGVSKDICARIKFACDAGTSYFADACGCGCKRP
jgi:hypothetical protein